MFEHAIPSQPIYSDYLPKKHFAPFLKLVKCCWLIFARKAMSIQRMDEISIWPNVGQKPKREREISICPMGGSCSWSSMGSGVSP